MVKIGLKYNMIDLFNKFPASSKTEWLTLVESELKGKSVEDVLHKTHPIEEVKYSSYGFKEDISHTSSQPGEGDFSRGGRVENNDWINAVLIPLDTVKNMNSYALKALMNGATGLKINLHDFSIKEIEELTKDIGFEHISSTFYYSQKHQWEWLNQLTKNKPLNITTVNTGQEEFTLIKNARNKVIKAIDVQYAGGNVVQEVAYALHLAHENLFDLMKNGLSIDEATQQIKFQFGIGSNYFFELTKFKVFRALYHVIVNEYKPKNTKSTLPYTEAESGFLNKSLKDPHNNLLRQTTEALSAILGGVDELTIRAYNDWSNDSPEEKEKAQRLGLNIALLLKEEAYADKVIDPAGGAYILENLYDELYSKTWEYFLTIEKKGLSFLKDDIQRISNKRIQLIESKSNTLIGVNKYFNEEEEKTSWVLDTTTPFGQPVILEKDCKIKEQL